MRAQLPIREFVYINKDRLEDFLSPLFGGMPYEHREAAAEDTARVDAGLSIKVANLQRVGARENLSWEELRRTTPASLFELLYQALKERQAVQELAAFDEAIWQQLQPGEFVLAPCDVQLSALERLFDLIKTFSRFMATLSPQQLRQSDVKQMLDYLNLLSEEQDSINVRFTPTGGPSQRHLFVGSLDKAHVRVNKGGLEGRFEVFGRIQQKLARGKTFELFSLMPQGLRLPREQLRELINKLQDTPVILGGPPKMEDLRVSYPAIVLTPVAVFR